MKIIIECFAKEEPICQVTSALSVIQINHPLERNFQIELLNLGQRDCDLALQASSEPAKLLDHELSITLSNGDKLIFRGQLATFLDQTQNLGSLAAGQTTDLWFDFDLLPLLTAGKPVQFDFALFFDFACADRSFPDRSPSQVADSAVLAVSQAALPLESAPPPDFTWFFYLLSSLFVLCFFAIIKFVHGKKKKQKN